MTATSRIVQITAADGHTFSAWRCDPIEHAKGGIVVLHAIFGLTSRLGEVCARWADAGYVAVAPALFARLGRELTFNYDRTEGGIQSYAALAEEQILTDVVAASAAAAPSGAVAISGFCTGGSWAWRLAAVAPFRAQVNFYGSHIPAFLDLRPRCPTILHYGDADRIVPPADIERIRAKHPEVELHVYPGAGHAFENPEQSGYQITAAALAWSRSIAFLNHCFGADTASVAED